MSTAPHALARVAAETSRSSESRREMSAVHNRGELDASTEVLLEGPELVLKDPMNSVTGRALSGMLAAQFSTQVSAPIIIFKYR